MLFFFKVLNCEIMSNCSNSWTSIKFNSTHFGNWFIFYCLVDSVLNIFIFNLRKITKLKNCYITHFGNWKKDINICYRFSLKFLIKNKIMIYIIVCLKKNGDNCLACFVVYIRCAIVSYYHGWNNMLFIELTMKWFYIFFYICIQMLWSEHLYQYNHLYLGPSWSYVSWIYNYLCNQCLSTIKLWVWTLFMARCTQYNIMW